MTQSSDLKEPSTRTELDGLSDADLLDAWAKDRYGEALATLVQRYSRLVISVCRRRCRTSEDADDAFQATFLHLARHANKIRRPECLPGWLHTVAQRAAKATLTRTCSDEPMEEPMANQDDPLEHIARRHESMVLDEELATLPEHYRAPIVMHVYEGWTFDRLADHFETTLGTIRGRVQRGKRMLASRLRRRGIVPVVAFAAATATMVRSTNVSASQSFIDAALGGTLPDSPIHPSHLEPLLQTGSKVMTPWNVAAGIAAVGTLSAAMLLPPPSGGTGDADVVSIGIGDTDAQHVAQLYQPTTTATPDQQPKLVQGVPIQPQAPRVVQGMPIAPQTPPAVGTGNNVGGPVPVVQGYYTPPIAAIGQPLYPPQPSPPSQTAMKIQAALDQPIDVTFETTLDALADNLEEMLGFPVILDDRAVSFGQLEGAERVRSSKKGQPLRTSLRRMLRPLGLKAVVDEEALVITADHHALARQGIGTDQWLNVDEDVMEEATKKLLQPIGHQFEDTPLKDAVEQLAEMLDLTMVIDKRALEEIGLDEDVPVSIKLQKVPARAFLSLMLKDLDLTITIDNGILTVTTVDALDASLLNRIYWLEGVGADRDYNALISMIQSTIEPEQWEQLGGSSTIVPAGTTRPAIVVSTTYNIHLGMEKLFETLRKNSFSTASKNEGPVRMPSTPAQTGGFM
ncbi:MAG: sigma-70 family RNA polymerase sigma factor [Planctomycetota bacterium]